MADYRILHDDDRCVKCGLCVAFCPCNVLEMNDEGFPYGAHPDQCVGCQTCSGNCPQRALTVEHSLVRAVCLTGAGGAAALRLCNG